MRPQRRAPTVRWGTTVRADRRLATLATPRPIWTATRPAAYPATRVTVGWGRWGRRAHSQVGPRGAPGHQRDGHHQGPDHHGQGPVGELDAGDAGAEVGQEHVEGVGEGRVVAGHGGAARQWGGEGGGPG